MTPTRTARMWTSERERRAALEDTVRQCRPGASERTVAERVEAFERLYDDLPSDEIPFIWKERWKEDREAERQGR